MTDKVQTVRAALQEARSGLENLLSNEEMLGKVVKAADLMVASMQQGGKVMSCGNGGSLCDAMHFAEELSGRFRQDRPAYAAMSLADPSHMSCVSNDYGYEDVFSRFVEGIGREGDVLLGITTSGTSKNVVKAAQAAKAKGIKVVALTGQTEYSDLRTCGCGHHHACRSFCRSRSGTAHQSHSHPHRVNRSWYG